MLGQTARGTKWRAEAGLSRESQKLHQISPHLSLSLPPKPSQLLDMQSAVCQDEEMPGSLFYQVWYGLRGAGWPSHSIHTRSRMGSSTEYVWGQKPGLLQKRMKKNKTGLNLKKIKTRRPVSLMGKLPRGVMAK